MKRIWILNHHSGLEGDRHYELAKEMVSAGLEVVVFMSAFDHQKEEYIYEKPVTIRNIRKGLSYVWLRTAPAYHGNGPARILNMMDYSRLMKRYEQKFYERFGKPEAVIGSSVHPFAWESAYRIARLNQIPFICEIRDFWPLSFIEMYGWSKYHPVCLLFSALERRAYRRADAIVTSMEFGYKYLEQFSYVKRDRVFWIPNGYHTEEIDRVLETQEVSLPEEMEQYLKEHWCAVYTGSFVDSECLPDLLDTAAYMQEHRMDEVKFAIIGDGHLRARMEERVEKEQLKNVRIFPRIEKSQVAVVLSRAKVCIAALQDDRVLNDLGLSLNKLNDYLYSGNPTVFACNSANVVEESGGGIVVPCSDPKAYAEALMQVYHMPEEERHAMGEKGRKEIREKYSYSLLAKQYMDILSGCEAG
ncbi:MAG: glycosyltransferase family 4 protein [Clostridiales bacterium]|nr:glycosyltransferase family 4 protein [Clostridiales bacterium]